MREWPIVLENEILLVGAWPLVVVQLPRNDFPGTFLLRVFAEATSQDTPLIRARLLIVDRKRSSRSMGIF